MEIGKLITEQEAKRIDSIPVGGNIKPDSCIYSYWFWKRIGEKISWDAATIALYYLKYLNNKDEAETKEVFKTLQQENEDLKKEVAESEKKNCIAFANWLSNQVLNGKTIVNLWDEYKNEIG